MNQDNIKEILCKILMLQKQDFDAELSGCDRPFLGPTPASTTYNTRPIEFYNSYTGELWEFFRIFKGSSSIYSRPKSPTFNGSRASSHSI